MPSSLSSRHPLRVLIVDADRRVRQSLSALVALEEDVDVVASAGDIGDALRAIEELSPDVLLLDPRLPELSAGMSLLRAVRDGWPDVRILVMSASAALEDPALANGAFAFVPKSAAACDLLAPLIGGHATAIRPVAS